MSGPLIQITRRNDLAANWTTANPIMAEGEIGIEWDTGWHKIGDGFTAWNDLGYYHGPPWWGGLDGGSPASTYSGAPSGATNFGVMCYPSTVPEPVSTEGDPAWANIKIEGVGYDGDNTVLVGAYIQSPTFQYSLYVTDTDLSTPTVLDLSTVTGYSTASIINLPMFILYAPTLSRWLMATGVNQIFYCDGDPSIAANWIESTPDATVWPNLGAFGSCRNCVWDYGLEIFYHFTDGQINSYLTVSVDGINWSRQSDHQVLGGLEPEELWNYQEFNLGGTRYRVGFQKEEYIWKTGNSGAGTLPGAASGWTKESANGVMRNTSQVIPENSASDGTVYACAVQNEINATEFSLSHPARWGPDGNANKGWDDVEMGWPNFNDPKRVFMHLPQYARPWIVFRVPGNTVDPLDQGWFDAASITYAPIRDGVSAPQFARCTSEPFKTLNDELDANVYHTPSFLGSVNTNYGAYNCGYIDEHTYGQTGFHIVMRTAISRAFDYLIFRKPG